MIPVILIEATETSSNIIEAYHSSNDALDIHNYNPWYLGVHCGTEQAALDRAKKRNYTKMYKLTFAEDKEELVLQDLGDAWEGLHLLMLAQRSGYLSRADYDRYRSQQFRQQFRQQCPQYANDNYITDQIFRGWAITKGNFHYIKYVNEKEDPGSISYLIFDYRIIQSCEELYDIN